MSFPSLHDALSSLLPGERGGPDWPLRPGMPGFGEGVDPDLRGADAGHHPGRSDIDPDGMPRPPGPAEGNGPGRHAHPESGVPPYAHRARGDTMRGSAPQPLAPPAPPGPSDPGLHALARELQQLPPSVIRQLGDVLQRNPDALRSLPAQPEALASVLARAAPDGAPQPQAAVAQARRLATEAAAPGIREADAVREARQAVAGQPADARTAGEARTTAAPVEPRPGLPGARESSLGQALEGRTVAAEPGWSAGMRMPAGHPGAPCR